MTSRGAKLCRHATAGEGDGADHFRHDRPRHIGHTLLGGEHVAAAAGSVVVRDALSVKVRLTLLSAIRQAAPTTRSAGRHRGRCNAVAHVHHAALETALIDQLELGPDVIREGGLARADDDRIEQ